MKNQSGNGEIPVNEIARRSKQFLEEHFEGFVLFGITPGQQDALVVAGVPKAIHAHALNHMMNRVVCAGGVLPNTPPSDSGTVPVRNPEEG